MSLAEQVVVLGGAWVAERRKKGCGELLKCSRPLRLNSAVIAEVGNVTPIDIDITRNEGGYEKRMKALRVGVDLIYWEPY